MIRNMWGPNEQMQPIAPGGAHNKKRPAKQVDKKRY